MAIAERLQQLGVELPEPPTPAGLYRPAVRSGDLVYISGQVPMAAGQLTAQGKVGADVDQDTARAAARVCAINCLAAALTVIDSLDRVVQVVRLTGYVASAAGFNAQPAVVDGASELMRDVFGTAGMGTRAAVGVAELPLNAPVEVDAILRVRG